jgi:uncharacterized protein (DUF983 family)
LVGKVYAGVLRMNENCPTCGHHFQREPGYFLGAMYISYPLSLVVIGLTLLVLHWLRPDWGLELLVYLTVPVLILFMPAIVRWSRVAWMHWDPPRE